MTKMFCHDGFCVLLDKEGKDHSKVSSAELFISAISILFISAFIAAVICGALVEMFTL